MFLVSRTPIEINLNEKKVIIIGKIIERIVDVFSFNPIRSELRYIERQKKQNKKDVKYLKKEIKSEEHHLFFLKGKLEQIQKENKQLEIWEKNLRDEIELKTIEIFDLSSGKDVSKSVELNVKIDSDKKKKVNMKFMSQNEGLLKFSKAMAEMLNEKEEKYNDTWTFCELNELIAKLQKQVDSIAKLEINEHLAMRRFIHIANYCYFLYNRLNNS